MRRRCPGTTERRRSLRCRRCWQGSRASDHRCLSSMGGGIHPPPSLRVCACVLLLVFLFCVHWAKALVGHWCTTRETKRARHAIGPRARPRNFFFFFFTLLRINPEDAMCRSETGHHISCCCCCRHKGSAGREDRGRRAREKRGEKLWAVAATQRGQLHRMMTGLGALRGGFRCTISDLDAGSGGVGRLLRGSAGRLHKSAARSHGGRPTTRRSPRRQTLSRPWKHTRTHTDQAALFCIVI